MKRVIVTGAAGFFGIHATEAFLRHGCEVVAVARPGSLHNERLYSLHSPLLSVVECDMAEIGRLPALLTENGIPVDGYDTFCHLAWAGGRNDLDAQVKNIDNSLQALRSAEELHCRRFIGAGSQAEYGETGDTVITEETVTKPFSAYGAAKVSACSLTRVLAAELSIEWIWCRIFSLIGRFEPKGRMLPDLIRKLRTGEEIVLSCCEQYWDYLDADDAAEALAALLEKGRAGEIYHIANGDYRPLKEYTEKARELIAPGVTIRYGAAPKPFVSLRPSVEKLRKDTGFVPRVSFEESIKGEGYGYE